jgi:penicillin amidase
LPIDPSTIPSYTPESIVALTLFFLWYLGSTVDLELELAEILEAVGPDIFSRVMRVAPVFPTITLPDFMSQYWDHAAYAGHSKTAGMVPKEAVAFFKRLPRSLISNTHDRIRRINSLIPLGSSSAHSNNWVVSGTRTHSGYPFVCNDPHLSMLGPSNFFMVHIDSKTYGDHTGTSHFAGGAIPGLPGILLGHNDKVAWAQTAMFYDATDLYVETILPGGTGNPDEVLFGDVRVPILKVTENFRLGMKPDSPVQVHTIEVVPHHGPILPGSRQGNKALSLKWIGYVSGASTDILTFFKLLAAGNIEDIFEAMKYYRAGSGNWVFADTDGNIGYSGHSSVPVRENQNLYPPYLPMPGTGEAEWITYIPEAKLPWARNPEAGFITSSNNDVIGTTLDNDPLNDEYYLYYCRKPAFRSSRIEDRLRQALEDEQTGGSLTLGHMMNIQADTVSLLGTKFVPHILSAAERYPERVTSPMMAEAIQRLSNWDYTTLTGVEAAYRSEPPDPLEVENSNACSIFHVWLNHFIRDSLDDEFGNQPLPGSHGEDGPQFEVKALLNALEDVSASILFDNIHTTEVVEGADDIILQSLSKALDTLQRLFGTQDMGEWRWGVLHTATFAFGLEDIALPDFISPVLGPYPNDGANFTVDVGNQGGLGDTFYQVHCPQMRFVTEARPPEFKTHIVIPCGQSGVRGDKHFDDLMPLWLNNEYVELDFTPDRVIADMENHLVCTP